MAEIPTLVPAISGAIGSSIASFSFFPLDIVVVRQQVQRSGRITPHEQASIVETLKHIIAREGWCTLYKGCFDDLLGTFLQSFLYFYAYEYLRTGHIRSMRRKGARFTRTLGVQYELFYGSLAGLLCKLVTTPIKNIVILKQVEKMHSSKSVIDYCREIYARKGVTGFWSGYKATTILAMNPSLAYYFYHLLSSYYKSRGALAVFLNAAFAKAIATLLTYPIIQAKTRVQASRKRSYIISQMWDSLKQDGFRGWFNGVNAQLLKGFFVQGVSFSTKEKITMLIMQLYLRRA